MNALKREVRRKLRVLHCEGRSKMQTVEVVPSSHSSCIRLVRLSLILREQRADSRFLLPVLPR